METRSALVGFQGIRVGDLGLRLPAAQCRGIADDELGLEQQGGGRSFVTVDLRQQHLHRLFAYLADGRA